MLHFDELDNLMIAMEDVKEIGIGYSYSDLKCWTVKRSVIQLGIFCLPILLM